VMAVWSKVNLRECRTNIRIDAEYYQPFFLKRIRQWREEGVSPLGNNYAQIMKRQFLPECGKSFDYIEIGCVSTILGTYDVIHLDDTEAPSRAQYVVKPGDVILSEVRPNRSAVSLIPEGIGRTVCSSGFGVLKAERVSPEYLFAFLKTSIITKLLDRETTATMYPAVADRDVLALPFPQPSKDIEKKVTSAVQKVFSKLSESKELYTKAERLLLEDLELNDLDLSPKLYYMHSASESQKANRLDAEYFQPKYYRLLEKLKKAAQNLEGDTIGKLSEPLRYGTSDKLTYVSEGIPFLRIADLENRRFEMSSVLHIPIEEAIRQKSARVKTGDVLVSRSGTLGLGVATPEELHDAVFGSYFIRLRPNKEKVNPEYLALFINALCGVMQVDRVNTGCIQTNLTIPAIESIFVVFGDRKWQNRYVDVLTQSVTARKESRQLLEEAIHLVEDGVLKGAN